MATWILIIFTFTALSSSGNCAVNYIYNLHSEVNAVEQGTSVTISCFFNGSKPLGPSRWTLDGQVVAVDCKVQTVGMSIITATEDCSPDNGNGIANYSFVINSVLLDRDTNTWMCQNTGLNEPLHFPISVFDRIGSHNGKPLYSTTENLTVTADIGCTYPNGEVLWCLEDETDVKCSNQSDWADNIFTNNPVISQTTEKCNNFKAANVSKHRSTITGTITSTMNGARYNLFYFMNGHYYRGNVIWISLEGICTEGLHITILVVCSLVIVVQIIMTTLSLVYIKQLKRTDYNLSRNLRLKFMTVVVICYGLTIASYAIYTVMVVSCYDRLLEASLLVGCISAFLVVNVPMQIYTLRLFTKTKKQNKEDKNKEALLERQDTIDKKNQEYLVNRKNEMDKINEEFLEQRKKDIDQVNKEYLGNKKNKIDQANKDHWETRQRRIDQINKEFWTKIKEEIGQKYEDDWRKRKEDIDQINKAYCRDRKEQIGNINTDCWTERLKGMDKANKDHWKERNDKVDQVAEEYWAERLKDMDEANKEYFGKRRKEIGYIFEDSWMENL